MPARAVLCGLCGKPIRRGSLVSGLGMIGHARILRVHRQCGRAWISFAQRGKPSRSNPAVIQSLTFPAARWTRAQVGAWAKRHGFRAVKIERAGQHYRIRQFTPLRCRPGSYRTLTRGMPAGLQMVACDVPRANPQGPGWKKRKRMRERGRHLSDVSADVRRTRKGLAEVDARIAARAASNQPASARMSGPEIYARIKEIKAYKRDGQLYRHTFRSPARIIGLSRGRLLITP